MSRRLLAAIPLIALVAACSSSETGGNRDKFTAWYVDAARQLHAAGFAVSIAVVPRSSELPGTSGYHRWLFDSWRGGYDLAAIGRASDFVSWMTYDQHTTRTPPGPP